MKIGIYKIISPSSRIYIGQSVDIDRRWKDHIRCTKSQPKLYNSIRKYGLENHIFEIIEECEMELLNDREAYWQDYYNSIKKGLNCIRTRSSDKSGYMCEESKLKISNSRKNHPDINFRKRGIPLSEKHKEAIGNSNRGRKRSEESRLKMSIGRKSKCKGPDHFLYGKEINEKSRKIFSELRKKCTGLNNMESKIVIDLRTGIYYYSIREAAYYNNIDRKRISGHRVNNSMLIIAEENDLKKYIPKKREGKKITDTFKIYSSISEYARENNISRQKVYIQIKNKQLNYV